LVFLAVVVAVPFHFALGAHGEVANWTNEARVGFNEFADPLAIGLRAREKHCIVCHGVAERLFVVPLLLCIRQDRSYLNLVEDDLLRTTGARNGGSCLQ